ncbi:phage tail length tape measure family protein, partial [Escherichia coli]|uniref:phage tail length tape measure family protein n=1 Tax=Escherichia coli TaxID=562 RepID=UPI00207B37DC
MEGNFADLTAVLTLDSARFSEEAARVKKELGETSALADLMSGKVSQSFRKQADAAEQSLSRQALAAQKAGISVGQYKAAMRTLPAQFTDIVTQLAGGQNPFLIMLQQGGQISDSFGGPLSLLTLLKEELLGIRDASESSEESLSDTANALAENARNAGELGRFMSMARVAAPTSARTATPPPAAIRATDINSPSTPSVRAFAASAFAVSDSYSSDDSEASLIPSSCSSVPYTPLRAHETGTYL